MKIRTKGQFYGIKQSDYHLGGVSLSEYDYLSQQTDWHVHEHPYFMYVLEGNLWDTNKQRSTPCETGSFLFLNWDEAHFNSKHSTNARGFHIELERQWFEERKLDIDLWSGSQLLDDPYLHQVLAKLYAEFSRQDSFAQLSIELLLLELCERIQTKQTQDQHFFPPWITKLKELLHDHQGDISLAFLSSQLDVHPVHLSRSVPKYFSVTLGEYIRQIRIKASIKYLIDPSYSLTEIAHLCGFSDQSHFTRTFKSYFSQTPRSYRKSIIGAKTC